MRRMNADDFIARLDGVRQNGPESWSAKCPAHDDKAPSLSIRDAGDRLLVHCFSGCSALEIVGAVGLDLADLFADKRVRRNNEQPHRLSASQALEALGHECSVVAIIASDMLSSRAIDEDDWQRLATAVRRIGSARAACCTARANP